MWCVRCRHTPNKNVQLNATLRHPFKMVNPSLEWLRTLKFLIVSRCTLTLIWWVNKRMVDFKVLDHNLSKDDEIGHQVRWVMELIKDPGSWIWMIIISPRFSPSFVLLFKFNSKGNAQPITNWPCSPLNTSFSLSDFFPSNCRCWILKRIEC